MEETLLINKGYNKLLYEKRLELGLSSKEACKKLHIDRLSLHLIENGYFTLSNRLKNKFISGYNLDQTFFDNDLSYPVMISEDTTPISKDFLRRLYKKKVYKIVCVISSILFLGMSFVGVGLNITTKNSIPSFYDSNVITVRNNVIQNHDDEVVSPDNNEVMYEVNNLYDLFREDTLIYFDVFKSEQRIPYAFFSGTTRAEVVLPFIDPELVQDVNICYSSYTSQTGFNYTVNFKTGIKTVASIAATKKGDKFQYSSIWYIDGEGNKTLLEKKDPNRAVLIELFENNIGYYEDGLTKLFSEHPTLSTSNISYEAFSSSLRNGNENLRSRSVLNGCLLIFGIVFACLFFALSLLSFFKRDPILDTNESPAIEATNNEEISEKPGKKPSKLTKNWKIFPFLPGDLLRLASIILIFIYSIGTYLLFSSIMAVDIKEAFTIFTSNKQLGSYLVIAFFLLLFVKNDMVQQRKDYFLTNYFYFFSGLALYLLVLALSTISVADTAIRRTIEGVILNLVPGNFLWGFLAFNMIVFLLFYTPLSYKNDQKKLTRYRCLAIIPFAYLVISLILGLLDSFLHLNMPFWLSFLFFTKSPDLIIFLILFTGFCFFYKRYINKKYSKEDATLFEKGNRYYFVKNIAACVIVALIGISELLFLKLYPNNPAGFGNDVLIFITIPFMLLYHPHHGKRNGTIDWAITIFYGVANVIGIALIILSILQFVIKYM